MDVHGAAHSVMSSLSAYSCWLMLLVASSFHAAPKSACCFSISGDACKCGYLKSEHAHEAIKPDKFTGQTWKKLRHIREGPTDAFGDISFGGLGQKAGKVKLRNTVHRVCVCLSVCV